MDKKNSITLHDIRFIIGKSGWVFLVGILIFTILIPFFTAGLPGDSIFDIEVTHDQLKFRLIHGNMVSAVIIFAVAIGFITGASLFRFVQDKKDTTIFFSMGITRSRLFCNRAAAGFIMLAAMTIIPVAISAALNISALGNYQGLIRNAVFLWAGIFMIGAISYIVAVIMCFISGNLMELIIFWAGTMSAPTIICSGLNLLMKKLYWGNAWGEVAYSGAERIKESLLEHYSMVNPVLFFKEPMETHRQFMRPLSTAIPDAVPWGLILSWAAVLAVLTYAAWYLMKIWKAENSGISGNSTVFAGIVSALTGFLVFAIVLSYLFDFSRLIAVILASAAFLASQLFWKKTGIWGQLSISRQTIAIVAESVAVFAICMIFFTGFLGNVDRFLEKGHVIQAEVTYTGAPSLLCEEATGSSTGRGYYIVSRLKLSDSDSIEKVKELHHMFEASGKNKMVKSEEPADTVIPYDISFSYTDPQGKEHIWYYDRASYDQLEQMLMLEELQEVQQGQESLFTGLVGNEATVWAEQAYSMGTVYITDRYLSNTYELSLGQEDRDKLLAAIQTDISDMSVEERYFSDDKTSAVIMFSQEGEDDSQYFTYHLDNAFIYVNENYTNTLKWLEDNQLLEYLQQEPQIEAIMLQRMDPYIGINAPDYPIGMYFMSYCADSADEFLIQKDFGNTYTITDEEEIAEISAGLQNGYYMSRGGYLAAVKLAGESRYRYMFLPENLIPEFIRG